MIFFCAHRLGFCAALMYWVSIQTIIGEPTELFPISCWTPVPACIYNTHLYQLNSLQSNIPAEGIHLFNEINRGYTEFTLVYLLTTTLRVPHLF